MPGLGLSDAKAATTAPELVPIARKAAEAQPMIVDWPVFSGASFPKIDYLNPDIVAAVAGPYDLGIRYFDAQWNEVTVPAAPGRYGAIVTAKFVSGTTITREFTIYRTPTKYIPALDPYGMQVTLPSGLGLPPGVSEQERWMISDFYGRTADATYNAQFNNAELLAALADAAADPARWHGQTLRTINGEWWLTLHEKLGTAQEYQRVVGLPEGYEQNPAAKWPLILYLHIYRARHGDLDTLANDGPLAYMKEGHLPFIVVAPLCPDGERWQPRLLARLLDQLEKDYRIDPKRVYVTGASLGGYGTLDFASAYPERVAAIAPIAAGANPALAERLGKMPAWFFHGGEDNAVPARYSVDLVAAMKRAGAPVMFSYFKDRGHGGWPGSRWGKGPYEGPELYAWFLKYSRP